MEIEKLIGALLIVSMFIILPTWMFFDLVPPENRMVYYGAFTTAVLVAIIMGLGVVLLIS